MAVTLVRLGLKDVDGDGNQEYVWRVNSTESSDVAINWDMDGTETGSFTLHANSIRLFYTDTTTGTMSIYDGTTLLDSSTANSSNYTWTTFGSQADNVYGMDGGDDVFYAGAGDDYVRGLGGNDYIEGDSRDDTIEGNAGNDTIIGDGGEDVIYGNTGDDSLNGGNKDDSIHGGADNDTIDGGANDDTINGGSGTDQLITGTGNDIIIVDVIAGDTDIVTDFDLASDQVDVSVFGYTYIEDMTLTQVGLDTVVDLGNGQTLTLQNITATALDDTHFIGVSPPPPPPPTYDIVLDALGLADVDGDGFDEQVWRIDNNEVSNLTLTWDLGGESGSFTALAGTTQFMYTDTTTGTLTLYESGNTQTSDVAVVSTVPAPYTLGTTITEWYGSEGADNVSNSNVDKELYGRGGDDTITASGGDDTIDGGDGNDSISAGNGTDTVTGGDGNDTIDGGGRNDTIDGGAGNDDISGGSYDDIITDGTGSDTLTGGSGTDSFIITQNAGDADVITDLAAGTEQVDLSAFTNITYFRDLNATEVGSDLVLNLGNGQTLTLQNESLSTIDHNDLIGVAEDPPGTNITGTANQPATWERQWYVTDVPTEFQFADVDNNGTMEFYGIYDGVLWQYDLGTTTWERQWFANEDLQKFQFVNTDGDSALEFYGLYDNQLWEYDGSWQFTFHADMQDFYFANNDGDANVELFSYNMNGLTWEFDLGGGGWSVVWQLYNASMNDFQIVDIDQDGTVDTTYSGGGLLQAFEAGQGWTLYPELGQPSQYQIVDIDNDGQNELAGVYGGQLWVQEFAGGDGADTLTGGTGDDTIDGLSGDDVITGGVGADRFEFAGTVGNDTITDYDDGTDTLAFSVTGFTTAADIVSATSYGGGNAVIDLGAAGQVTLTGITSGIDVSDIVIF